MRIGFIGLGNLGEHLAASLLRAGFGLTVHDLAPERAQRLLAAGASWAASPAATARAADSVITCLPSPAAVRAVVEEVLDGLPPGGTWIDMSTNDPDEVKRLAALAASPRHRLPRGAGHRRRAQSRERRDHRAGRRRGGAVRGAPAGLRRDGRRGDPHGAAGQRLGDQGDHQHAGLRPSGRARRGADAGQAGRARPRQGLPCDPRELGQQLRPRDREPGDPRRQLRHRLHAGPRLQGPRPRDRPRPRASACRSSSPRWSSGPSSRARERYGGNAWSPMVVRLLEDALGAELRAAGFPARLHSALDAVDAGAGRS